MTSSRIKGLQAFLKSTLLLKIRGENYARHRLRSREELAVVSACVERLQANLADLKTLNLADDPREARRARKTPQPRTSR